MLDLSGLDVARKALILARKLGATTQVWGPWAESEMVATIPEAPAPGAKTGGHALPFVPGDAD